MKLPPEFDLHALEVFLLTVELGGMSQCAAQLQCTQSAISQTIAKLENGIGASLFDRSLRPLGLTATGKSLFERGQRLMGHAKLAYHEVRAGAALPIASVSVAMSESLANQLTSPLLEALGARAEHWNIRSGISQVHHQAFLAREVDMLVTGSSRIDHQDSFQHLSVLDEYFVMVLPHTYRDPVDLVVPVPLPFIRYSRLSGMGQQIERQIMRMKLKLSNLVEVDSTWQQLSIVASGYGWSITSPLCLAGQPHLLDRLRVEPMPRGRFARCIQIIARADELGDLPSATASLTREVLHDITFPPLLARYPWLDQQIAWVPAE